MGKICWDFPRAGTGNDSGVNDPAIQMFKRAGILDSLAREICQNSLDAKDKSLKDDVPVKVKFEMINVSVKDYPMLSEYEEYVDNAIDYWRKKTNCSEDIMSFLKSIKETLRKNEIPVLVISDYNTTGLRKEMWDTLVESDKLSWKLDSNAAGSYGVGKNAPFAYSSLNLVFYNNLIELGGERSFEGVTRLVTTQKKCNCNGDIKLIRAQDTGKFLYLEDEDHWRPIRSTDGCKIANIDIFKRKDIGTDVAIFGFKKYDDMDWENNIAIAVIKNFILAIMNGKLEISIKSPEKDNPINIDKSNIEELLYKTFSDEKNLRSTRQIFETVNNKKGENIFNIIEEGDLTIFIKENEEYTVNVSISSFRSTGMLINTTRKGKPRFSVVVAVNAVGEKKLDKALRDSEPPEHNKWDASVITKNIDYHKQVEGYIKEIETKVKECIEKLESSNVKDQIDAGIGDFLPAGENANKEKDGLINDVEISKISYGNDGDVIYDRRVYAAETAKGQKSPNTGIKVGKKKHRKKDDKKIRVVKPGSGNENGVSSGTGKVRVVAPEFVEHRTFYSDNNKYRLYINSPETYNKIFIQYYAGRDDEREEPVIIKNIKVNNFVMQSINKEEAGPISLEKGANVIEIEFEHSEKMAVIPVFTMEVSNEK